MKINDVRSLLRSGIRELPDAPCYIILFLDNDDIDKWYARLEAGFVAGNMLLQGSAIGVGSWGTTGVMKKSSSGTKNWFHFCSKKNDK